MSDLGDVSINSKHYRIDMNTWRRRDLSDFSPRASVPGGASVYNDLLLYQPLVQEDWRHGFGFSWFRDEAGYQFSHGNIDTRHENLVMMYTASVLGANDKAMKGWITWDSKLYGWNDTGLYRRSSMDGTFSLVYTGKVNYALGTSDYLFVFPDGTRPYYSKTGDANVTPFVKATIDTSTGVANSNLRFTAIQSGVAGNTITVTYATGASAADKAYVTVVDDDITVTLHANTTALQVMNAMLADVPAYAQVVAKMTGTNNSILWTAKDQGESGNDIKVIYKLGATGPGLETVAYRGTEITIIMHRRTKAAQVIDVVARDATAAALVVGSNATPSDGTGKIIQTDVKNTWTKTWQLSDGSVKKVTDLISVELKPGETGAGKPGAMAAVTLADGAGTESWIQTGVNEYATDFKWVTTFNGYVYAGKDGSNLVFYASESDLADLHGRKEDDPSVIFTGNDDLPTLQAVVYSGQLYVSKEDGLYNIGADNIARRVLDYTSERSSSNFRSLAVYQGYLIFPIRDRVYQWNGSRLSDVTPPRLSDTFPYITYGQFANFVSVGRYLYMVGYTNETTFRVSLLCWDMVGWFELTDITIGSSPFTVTSMAYDAINNYLWYSWNSTNLNYTYYVPFQALSEFPYASFPTSGTNYLQTSKMDMGFKRIQKSTPSLLITAANLSSTRYLLVYYRLNGTGGFLAWGGTAGTTNKVATSGITELTDPLGTGTRSTLEYYHIEFQIEFVTGTAAQSPILQDLTLRFILRPDTYYGWSFQIVAAGDTQYGMSVDERTAKDILTDLETARNSKKPVIFIDPWGVSNQVYVTAMNEAGVEYHVDEAGVTRISNTQSRSIWWSCANAKGCHLYSVRVEVAYEKQQAHSYHHSPTGVPSRPPEDPERHAQKPDAGGEPMVVYPAQARDHAAKAGRRPARNQGSLSRSGQGHAARAHHL